MIELTHIEMDGKPIKLMVFEVPADATQIRQGYKRSIHYRRKFSTCKIELWGDFKFTYIGTVSAKQKASFDIDPYVIKSEKIGKVQMYRLFEPAYKTKKRQDLDLSTNIKRNAFDSLLESNGIYFVNHLNQPTKKLEMQLEPHENFDEHKRKYEAIENGLVKGKLVFLKLK